MSVPKIISEDEPLLRAFSIPSGLDQDNRATPLVFRLRPIEDELSLTRLLYHSLVNFLKEAIKFKFLIKSESCGGAVELYSSEIKSIEHIVLKATPKRNNPAHASIYYYCSDGTQYKQPKKTNEPTDHTILECEMALASVVKKVYDIHGNVIWSST